MTLRSDHALSESLNSKLFLYFQIFARYRVTRRMCAMVTQAAALAIDFSQSFDRRRHPWRHGSANQSALDDPSAGQRKTPLGSTPRTLLISFTSRWFAVSDRLEVFARLDRPASMSRFFLGAFPRISRMEGCWSLFEQDGGFPTDGTTR